MSDQCIWPAGCNLPIDRFMHCWRHANLLGIPKPEKKVYRIPAQSEKRKQQQPVYRKIVAQKIQEAEGVCQVRQEGCQWVASGMNHVVKRSPGTWLKEENLIPCCDGCNGWIERNPLEAIELGFSKSKFLK